MRENKFRAWDILKKEKDMTEKNNLKITTDYNEDLIDQQLSFNGKMISRQVMYMQDTGVKEALIKLGWTPPIDEDRPANRIFCEICGNEICEIAIDLISNITTVCCNTCRDKIIELEEREKSLVETKLDLEDQIRELESQFLNFNGEL